MADIEKVKKGLKTCSTGNIDNCRKCPYFEAEDCDCEMISDVLDVIAELEERIAIMEEPVEKKWYPKSRMWECQGCGDVVRGIDKYCSHCGRKFIEEECEDE